MGYDDAVSSACSTCKVRQDLSNYWTPNLYYESENGKFETVKQLGGMLVYYLQRSDSKDPEYENGLLAFPPGFQMLAGDPSLRSFGDTLEQRAISYVCLGVSGPETHQFPSQNCPYGLRVQVMFPSCWDGHNLDSPNHKSHMAYPSLVDNGVCPTSHPKRFITLFYEVTFQIDDFKDRWYKDTPPFVYSNGGLSYSPYGDVRPTPGRSRWRILSSRIFALARSQYSFQSINILTATPTSSPAAIRLYQRSNGEEKFSAPDPGDGFVGYAGFSELCKDLQSIIDVLWLSGTPSLQIPFLLNVASEFTKYIVSFPPSPRATFAIVRKLDKCFASLLCGQDIDTKEPLPGFENGLRAGMTTTDMVRCRSLVEQSRILVMEVLSSDTEETDDGDPDDGGESDTDNDRDTLPMANLDTEQGSTAWVEDDEARLSMDVVRVYENTIVQLGNRLGDTLGGKIQIGIGAEDHSRPDS
ncbi:hypothetical protein ACHAQG_005159 [Verticillium nonalfalfae]